MTVIATNDPFVVTNGQTYVTIAHNRVNGPVKVSGPSLSAKNPDDIRPKPAPAFAKETR